VKFNPMNFTIRTLDRNRSSKGHRSPAPDRAPRRREAVAALRWLQTEGAPLDGERGKTRRTIGVKSCIAANCGALFGAVRRWSAALPLSNDFLVGSTGYAPVVNRSFAASCRAIAAAFHSAAAIRSSSARTAGITCLAKSSMERKIFLCSSPPMRFQRMKLLTRSLC